MTCRVFNFLDSEQTEGSSGFTVVFLICIMFTKFLPEGVVKMSISTYCLLSFSELDQYAVL